MFPKLRSKVIERDINTYTYIYLYKYIYIYEMLRTKTATSDISAKKVTDVWKLTKLLCYISWSWHLPKVNSWYVVQEFTSSIIWGSCCCCISIKLHLMFVAFGCKWNKINGIALQFVIPITASNDKTSSPPSELLLTKAPIFGISWIEWPCCDTISSILC